MSGYSSQRKSLVMGKAAYGLLTIPTNYAGICPAPQTTEYVKNIIPEIFFGFYNAQTGGSGLDIGIRVDTGGGWVGFAYGTSGYFSYPNSDKVSFKSTISPGETIYMKSWIQNSKAYLNVSKTGYTNTDMLDAPWSVNITNTTFAARANSGQAGYEINREISIASNPASYETSGTYNINAQFLQCGFITTSEVTYIWTDANSLAHAANSQELFGTDANGRRVIRLRKDGAMVNASRIKLIGRTDSGSGATEKVSIDFKLTPTI